MPPWKRRGWLVFGVWCFFFFGCGVVRKKDMIWELKVVHGGFKLLGRAFGEIHPISSYLFFRMDWVESTGDFLEWKQAGDGNLLSWRVELLLNLTYWWREQDCSNCSEFSIIHLTFNHPFCKVSETEWVALFQSAEKGGGHLKKDSKIPLEIAMNGARMGFKIFCFRRVFSQMMLCRIPV